MAALPERAVRVHPPLTPKGARTVKYFKAASEHIVEYHMTQVCTFYNISLRRYAHCTIYHNAIAQCKILHNALDTSRESLFTTSGTDVGFAQYHLNIDSSIVLHP